MEGEQSGLPFLVAGGISEREEKAATASTSTSSIPSNTSESQNDASPA
ncbi:hypothetical protein [Streptomyces sp. NPDC001410]